MTLVLSGVPDIQRAIAEAHRVLRHGGRLLVLDFVRSPWRSVRVVQRRIVQDAVAHGRDRDGLALARALAMTTYRSQEEFQARFAGGPALTPEGPRLADTDTTA